MQIRQISAALDTKLAQLEKKLKQLQEEQRTAPREQLQRDIQALEQMRDKLIKSKALAWRAHDLQDQNDEVKRARQRAMGLTLCVISVIGAVALIFIALN